MNPYTFRIVRTIRSAERQLASQCDDISIGESCRRACIIGGMTVISDVLNTVKNPIKKSKLTGAGRLGIFVSPFDDCPKGFESIFVESPRNQKVKICRLDSEHRRKIAPKGKPYRSGATKGALRRKKAYTRGTNLSPLQRRAGR